MNDASLSFRFSTFARTCSLEFTDKMKVIAVRTWSSVINNTPLTLSSKTLREFWYVKEIV